MIQFEIRRRALLGGMVALRWKQFKWTVGQAAWVLGLMPPSGKWLDRVSFVYIYVLIVAILTPSTVNTLGALYALEAKTSPALELFAMQRTIPILVAIFSVGMIINPWKAWMLRLTFGDITYLSPSPFDRRVLAIWRFIEMVVAVPVLAAVPLILIAPMFGSIWAADVIPTILRLLFAIGLWAVPVLALGWHVSLQEYSRDGLPSGVQLITRLGLIIAAGALAVANPDLLLWPGRLIVAMSVNETSWAWAVLIGFAIAGLVVVWVSSRHLSLTKASAGSEVFARIQQLGVMIFLDRRLLLSILAEARANEGYAVGVLPSATGAATFYARAALYYRRRLGQALQLFLGGLFFGLALIFWRPYDVPITALTAGILAFVVPPWIARLFRQDQAVPFITQFVQIKLRDRLINASIVPTMLILAGLLPVVLVLNSLMPTYAWGVLPIVWIMALDGHVEAIGTGNAPGDRNIFTVVISGIAIFVMLWGATANELAETGIPAVGRGLIFGVAISLALLMWAEIRHGGLKLTSDVE